MDKKTRERVRNTRGKRLGEDIELDHDLYDIAEAFKSAEVPEELKRKMAIRDDAHARRANRTAVTWLSESLGAKQGDKVGVLIFWCDKSASDEPEVVFLLVKGDPESQYTKVKAICFGNPILRSAK